MQRNVHAGSLVPAAYLNTYRGWTVVDGGMRRGVLTDSVRNKESGNVIHLVIDGRAEKHWTDQILTLQSPGHEEVEDDDDGIVRIAAKNLSLKSEMRKYKGWTLVGFGVITDSIAPHDGSNRTTGKIYIVVDGELRWFYYDTVLKLQAPDVAPKTVYHDVQESGTVSWARCSPGAKGLLLATARNDVNCKDCLRLKESPTAVNVHVTNESIDKESLKEIVKEVLDEREEEDRQRWRQANWPSPPYSRPYRLYQYPYQ